MPCVGKPHARFDEGGQGKTFFLRYPFSFPLISPNFKLLFDGVLRYISNSYSELYKYMRGNSNSTINTFTHPPVSVYRNRRQRHRFYRLAADCTGFIHSLRF